MYYYMMSRFVKFQLIGQERKFEFRDSSKYELWKIVFRILFHKVLYFGSTTFGFTKHSLLDIYKRLYQQRNDCENGYHARLGRQKI